MDLSGLKFIRFFLFLVLISCEEVHFDKSLPTTKNVEVIGDYFIGEYHSLDTLREIGKVKFYNVPFSYKVDKNDSFFLFVEKILVEKTHIRFVTIYKHYYKKQLVDSLKISKRLNPNQKLYSQNKYFVKIDSNELYKLELNKDFFIKNYEKFYYLNLPIRQKEWKIIQINPLNDSIIGASLTNEIDKNYLKKKLTKKDNIYGPVAVLSNREFINFVKAGGFRDKFFLKKVKILEDIESKRNKK
jgi:hypothetical protein